MQPDEQPSPQLPAQPPVPNNRRKIIISIATLVGLLLLTGGIIIWAASWGEESKRSPTSAQTRAHSSVTPTIDTTVVLAGRQLVWDIAFLPSKEMLFTERGGTLSSIKQGQVSEVARISDVVPRGEGGLLGLAVDPQFKKNRFIYTCYNTATDIRVVRWRLADDLKGLQNRQDIVTGIPNNTTTFPGRHSGCRVAVGPDGYIWIGTGDTAQGDTSIQPKGLGGKVLRVTRDGKPAPGNLGGAFDARIYSYGHRNIQGLAFFANEQHGTLGVSAEHGSSVDDEVNELKKGNFGWAPPAEGYDESVSMTDLKRFPDAIPAIWSSGDPTQAPSGIAVMQGAAWKGWEGALAMAMLKDEHLKILRLDTNNKVTKEEKVLSGEYGRLRAVTMGLDGSLYISTSNGTDDKILKVTPR